MEGFGFQTKTLDLHVGPQIMCVKEIEVWGLIRLCNPARTGWPRKQSLAQEVHVVSVKDHKTASVLRGETVSWEQEGCQG